MIRVKAEFNAKPIEQLSAYVDGFNEMVQDVGQATFNVIGDQLLGELQTQPGPTKTPVEWTTPEQRRYVFGVVLQKDSDGNIIPYKRTGRAAGSWRVESRNSGGTFLINVYSTWEDAEYLYGTLNMRSVAEARRTQQRYHRNTGWQAAAETVAFWFDAAEEEFERNFNERIGQDLGTFTKRRRSRR